VAVPFHGVSCGEGADDLTDGVAHEETGLPGRGNGVLPFG
jgi:hypothetical protein